MTGSRGCCLQVVFEVFEGQELPASPMEEGQGAEEG